MNWTRVLNGAAACILFFNMGICFKNGNYIPILFFLVVASLNFWRAFCQVEKENNC